LLDFAAYPLEYFDFKKIGVINKICLVIAAGITQGCGFFLNNLVPFIYFYYISLQKRGNFCTF